jgi:soluble lytic murein transglycosylase-like protein
MNRLGIASVLVLVVLAPLSMAAQTEVSESLQTESVYYADAYAEHYGVPRELVHAIIIQESGWNPHAVSRKGALGIMQLMPSTAARLGVVDPFSITENIGGGVRYLAELTREFNGDFRLVVAAYYCGSHPIQRRGLMYSNPDVLSYVKSVRTLYSEEVAQHAQLTIATNITGEIE